MIKIKLSWEGALILLIGAIDLATTLWFVHARGAAEGNPLMRFFLAQGLAAFAIAKVGFCLIPVLFLEWAARRRPVLVRRAERMTIALYASAYLLGVFGINLDKSGLLYSEQADIALKPEMSSMVGSRLRDRENGIQAGPVRWK